MLPFRFLPWRRWLRVRPLILLLTGLAALSCAVSVAIASDSGNLQPSPAASSSATTPANPSAAPDTKVTAPSSAPSNTASAPPVDQFASTVANLRAADFMGEDDEQPTLDWLKIDPEALRDWQVQTVPNNPATLIVSPRWQAPAAQSRSVLVLIPIDSEVYSIAVSTNLTLFREKNIAATFTIVNYGSIENYGLALLEQAKRDRIDLILATGSRATDLAYEHFRDESIPVVGNTKDPVLLHQVADYDQGSGTNLAYTTFSVPFKTLQTYLLQLKPDLKNVAILYSEDNQSAIETQVEPMLELARDLGIQAHRYGAKETADPRAELTRLVPEAIATLRASDPDLKNSIFFLTGSVSVYREIATINRYAQQVPVIATLPDVVTAGDDSATISIGGDFRNTSYITALYAIRILRREIEPGDLPVGLVTPPDIAINFRRVRSVAAEIPFTFFEAASFVYDYEGRPVRSYGQNLEPTA